MIDPSSRMPQGHLRVKLDCLRLRWTDTAMHFTLHLQQRCLLPLTISRHFLTQRDQETIFSPVSEWLKSWFTSHQSNANIDLVCNVRYSHRTHYNTLPPPSLWSYYSPLLWLTEGPSQSNANVLSYLYHWQLTAPSGSVGAQLGSEQTSFSSGKLAKPTRLTHKDG